MAKNYTFKEAVEIIERGTDLESILDIGRRYPLMTAKVAAVSAKAGESFVNLMSFMPDYVTANKINSAIKSTIVVKEDDDEEEEKEEVTAKEKKTKKVKKAKKEKVVEDESEDEPEDEESGLNTYEKMNAMQLYKECKKLGIKAAPKKKAKFYLDLIKKSLAPVADENDDDDWGEEEEEVKETPKVKKEKKAKKSKKEKVKEEVADDDDDEWSI